jgi:AAA15 family ATPase/GTPase
MLRSLEIKNFRQLNSFQVPRLGQVNLIVGKNSIGKSTVLEALRIYAGNAQRGLLEEIAAEHDEKFPFEDFFAGRQFPQNEEDGIGIGEIGVKQLRIEYGFLYETEEVITNESTRETSTRIRRQRISPVDPVNRETGIIRPALFVSNDAHSTFFMLDEVKNQFKINFTEITSITPCSFIPTQLVSFDELADEWDKIVFTEHQEVVKEALKIISKEFEDLTFVRNDEHIPAMHRDFRRSAKVKMSDTPRPVPLNSLGDGMLRVLQLVLKVFSAKDGFLLIDEFENGLHFSVQKKVWSLLFEQAKKLNIQIFATTHSWDCIESFAKVAIARQDVEGVLFRVGTSVRDSDRGRVIATVFDEQALFNITQADVEVR